MLDPDRQAHETVGAVAQRHHRAVAVPRLSRGDRMSDATAGRDRAHARVAAGRGSETLTRELRAPYWAERGPQDPISPAGGLDESQ